MHKYLEHQIEIEVPFFDLDPMQIVWHGNYVKYFELARCALLEKIDYNYPEMRDSGYAWPVIELKLKYAHPAKMRDILVVTATVVEYEFRLKINYEIFNRTSNKRITKGYSVQVAVGLSDNEMCFQSPPILAQKLGVEAR
jgi:acyl-CoA thioester hydrolase